MTKLNNSLENKVNDIRDSIIKNLISVRLATEGFYKENSIYLKLVQNHESRDTLDKTLIKGYNLYLMTKYKGAAEINSDYLSENHTYRINWVVIADNPFKEEELISDLLTGFNKVILGYKELSEKIKKQSHKSKKSNRKYWR